MYKLIKNKKKLLIGLILITILTATIILVSNISKENDINEVLETKAYSYLPKEAKNYIEQVYKETGTILLTEKNKEENVPYLNPEYVEYLSSVNRDQSGEKIDLDNEFRYDVIPSETVIDYASVDSAGASNDEKIPSSFNLNNVNGKDFVTPIKDQKNTGLCWAFATNAQAESFLLAKSNTSYEEGMSQLFSEMQIDYATASNGIIDGSSLYSYNRNLGDGGNFEYATTVMSDSLGLVDVSWRNFNDYDYKSLEKNYVYKFANSKYEVTTTIDYPKLNLTELDLTKKEDVAKRDSYLNNLKKIVMENGGAYISIKDPMSRCSLSMDGTRLVYNDGKCAGAAHALQIVGWDDEVEYSFCSGLQDSKDYYYLEHDINKCEGGTVISGKGAWILKNSWGESTSISYPYVYLAYDSMNSEINMITGMDTKDWNNNYSHKATNGIITHKKENSIPEKLNKIKFKISTQAHDCNIYIGSSVDDLKLYKTINIDYPGIYTVDFSEENIIINSDFIIKVAPTGSGSKPQTIRLYTDNTESVMQIATDDISYENTLTNIDKYMFRISSKTINIPENTQVNYKILNQQREEIATSYSYSENIVFANQVFSKIEIDNTLKHGTYILQTIIDNEVMDESNITINKDIVTIDGSGTEEDPYVINTPSQLNLIRKDRFAYYKLGQDIDMTYDTQNEAGLFYNNGKGWEPIRYSDYSKTNNRYLNYNKGFSGGFDGNNHKIIGLYINRPDEDGVGLFANTYNENFSNLHIKNLSLVEPNITGNNWVGSLLGVAYGTTYERVLNISNIQVQGGTVNGNEYVGGIIGLVNAGSNLTIYNTATIRHIITNLYNSSTVKANNNAGGIFGMITNIESYGSRSPLTISNILNKGSVTSKKRAGGLVGYIIPRASNDINISDSINTGITSGEEYSSELVGEFSAESEGTLTLTNLYYINGSTLDYNNKNIIINNVSKMDLSNIKNISNYSAWSSFDENWQIKTIDGITRMPILKFVNFDYTYVEDFQLGVGEQINIYDLVNPYISLAKNINYEIEDSTIATIDEKGTIIGKKPGETTINIISYYDGYEKAVKINVYEDKKVTITFNSNNGTEVNAITSCIGEKIQAPENPIRENYKFDGWYLDNETFENKYEFDVMPEQDITLHAKWISLKVVINNYKVNNSIISNIKNNTTIEDYLNNFTYNKNLIVKNFNHKNELIEDKNTKVGTGSKIKFYNGDNLIEEYTNVVRADITGDGMVDLADLSKMFNYYRKNITMSGVYLSAGDITNDENVDLGDLAKLFNYYRGNIENV